MNEQAVNVFVKEDRLLSLHCIYCMHIMSNVSFHSFIGNHVAKNTLNEEDNII